MGTSDLGILVFVLGQLAVMWVSVVHCSAQSKPNVILIVADDLGWNDVGYHGSEVQTPTIDRLAKEGAELNRFYAHPTCSPSRSALMTGKAPIRLGILSPLAKNNRLGLPLSEKTMAEYFRINGYQTSLVGKWHLGRFKREHWPTNRGFDHFYGYLTGGIGHFDHIHGGGVDWQRNGKTVREEGYSTHLLTDEAVHLIESRDTNQPFFLELCFAAPHMPNEAPDSTIGRYQYVADKNRQLHAAMVTEMDRGIQRIYTTLVKEGILENTIIWFLSDNGGECAAAYPESTRKRIAKFTALWGTPLPIQALEFTRDNITNSASDNTPFRAGKGSAYEGGVRVPAFIYAPRFLKSQKIDQRITVNDVLPSLAAAVGFENFDATHLDGVNRWTFLTGQGDYASSDYVVHGTYGKDAYYQDHWKLVASSDAPPELYDLRNDPTEAINLAANNEEVVATMLGKLQAFPRGKSVHDPIWKALLDMDNFGGKEDRAPWAGTEGVNAGPLHPIYFILPLLLLGIPGLVWFKKRKSPIKSSI